MNRIITKKILSQDVKEFVIESPRIATARHAGQFVIVRANDTGERIPLTIADANPEAGTITLIFQEVGKSTMLMGTFKEGDEFKDVVGPLGKPTHIEKFGTVVCMGGGIGVAPMHPISEAMKAAGNRVITIIGARSKDLLIMENRMKAASTELHISTDDGSYGVHGFVTDILQSLIDKGEKIDLAVAIGPVPMMGAVCKLTKKYDLPTVVSLNPIMVDGTGMCGACRVTVAGKTQFVCVDGPEFDGHQVDFVELVKRQRAYLPQERISREAFQHHEGCCSEK
ncbi:ferredoxin-NADP reductase [candidate division LCP-89 bacterium B3_LCP]|uniref:Ferredoxin-NADP reductase n=1 Tax=candidate division LCP-89 bacterium B3_LCP TaxID=2012998 RepID=A0A532V5L0_UNCL8|nr:MAG: ferredoxin-NADP reductase [candidate division LCP-89 bacterium B3_LCP]